MRLYVGIMPRPLRIMPKMYPSVYLSAALVPAPIGIGGMPYFVTGPLPMPSGPWQTAQLIWN